MPLHWQTSGEEIAVVNGLVRTLSMVSDDIIILTCTALSSQQAIINVVVKFLGDTDSVFVKLPGKSLKEAWAFGKEFCDKVTQSNPPPVQLKLEKVYMGTLLQTVRIESELTCSY